MYYFRNRWYDPQLQRFNSEDPIGLEGGINPYAYAGNDPVNNRDPFGLECTSGQAAEGKCALVLPGVGTGDDWDNFDDYAAWSNAITWGTTRGRATLAGYTSSANSALEYWAGRYAQSGNPLDYTMGLFAALGTEPLATVDGLTFFWGGGIRKVGTVSVKGLATNPFAGKTARELHEMFIKKGYKTAGPDPMSGLGGYVNPRTGRSYHIDIGNRYGEPPHVDVNRLRSYRGPLSKRKYSM